MAKTFTAALDLLKSGDEQSAWEVAQQDEGMDPSVTMEVFIAYGRGRIEAQAATDAAFESASQHD